MLSYSSLILGQKSTRVDAMAFSTVVLLEKKIGDKFIPHGTGTLFYDYTDDEKTIVVTCEHVLKNKEIYVSIKTDSSLHAFMTQNKFDHLTFDSTWKWFYSDGKIRTKVELFKDSTFAVHPDGLDIAAFKIDYFTSMIHGKDTILITNQTKIPNTMIKRKSDVDIGEEVFFLGFPFGIGTEINSIGDTVYSEIIPNPLIRKGSVSWVSDQTDIFLLDAISYSGNSGSPIFSKTITEYGQDLKSNFLVRHPSRLIGMVFGHLGYDFENFGLARCVWSDDLLKVIDKLNKLK